ncbi:MAG: class I SAM-dependent methyltransferase [Chthoniobacterales bacterium]
MNFKKYSAYYDLLYADKNYQAEAEYVARRLRTASSQTRTILELGSGTGRHGWLLAAMGFEVHGIERSDDMISMAVEGSAENQAGFTCETGDLRDVRMNRVFDAVISLFHVISYQITDKDLNAAFTTAGEHLEPGGLFLFDVWHGPAVMATPPSNRVKEMTDERYRVKRIARPETNLAARTVKVVYDLDCEDLKTGHRAQFSEEHVMRYLFPDEIVGLATAVGFEVVSSEEFLTGRGPSADTWGVSYLLKKQDAHA